MGIHLHFYSYSNDGLVVVFPIGDDHFGRTQYRLLVMWKSFLDSASDGSDQEEETVRHRTGRFLDEFTPRVALAHFIGKVSANIGRLRKITFGSMHRGRKFGAYLRLSRTIHLESMHLERIIFEIEQEHDLVKSSMGELSTLSEFLPESYPHKANDLLSDTLEFIESRSVKLKTQLRYLKDSFADFLALQNMRSAYRLQRYVLWLSIIATIAAIAGAISAWPIIRQLFL
jgi:hypothetical protein